MVFACLTGGAAGLNGLGGLGGLGGDCTGATDGRVVRARPHGIAVLGTGGEQRALPEPGSLHTSTISLS
jgi:hypothetical protein